MKTDTPSPFERLRQAALAEPEPQRLLFVFTAAELPGDATPGERDRFAQGGGGALEPLMCVDKTPEELTAFDALVAESRTAGPPWHIVFAAGLSGRNGKAPDDGQVETALNVMIGRIRTGRLEGVLALDRKGNALTFI